MRNVAAHGSDLPHQCGGDRANRRRGRHKNGLHRGRHCGVHTCHFHLVVEIGRAAQAADQERRTLALRGGDGRTRSLAAETAGEPDRFETVERSDDDIAVILYTSGTTGRPKGVALSHGNLGANARSAALLFELDRADWGVAVLPLSHSYGLTLMNAGNILGTRAVLLRWFNPEDVLRTIQTFRATAMSGVPTMFVYLLNYPDAERYDTSSMRVWGSGAAPYAQWFQDGIVHLADLPPGPPQDAPKDPLHHRQRQIGIQITLVKLVEHDDRHAV